jgi:carbon-monoxide dehydrogenase medium subunit
MKAFQYLAPIAPFKYIRPNTMNELFTALSQYSSKAKLIAGGTDLTIALKDRSIRPEVVIDLNRLRPTLSGITLTKECLKIGAMTTYTDLERDVNVQRYATALGEAASQVGTYQIRNLGTIGANLANGSPAADTAPPLIVLSAQVNLQNQHGERKMAVEDFFTGVKKTQIRPDEVITALEIPLNDHVTSRWTRFARRNENVLSVVSVAVASEIGGRMFGRSRIALGAVAPTPILAKESSSKLSGSPITQETVEQVSRLARDESKPICDVRASAEYRRHLVYVLTKRCINRLVNSSETIVR